MVNTVNMVSMLTSYRCHLQPCSHYHLELSCKKWRRPSWGLKAEKEREWKKVRSMAWHGIRARTNGPEDRVSPVWVETHPFEGLMKGHHPYSFFAPIWCSWAHHLSLTISISLYLYISHCALFFLSLDNYTHSKLSSLLLTMFLIWAKSTMVCLTNTEKPILHLSLFLCGVATMFVCLCEYLFG